MTLEDLDKTEDLSLDDISEELGDLKQDIDIRSHKKKRKEKQEDKNKTEEEIWDSLYWIPKNVGLEYSSILSEEIKRQEKLGYEIAMIDNDYYLNKLWFGNLHFSHDPISWYLLEGPILVILFYIKKLCPKNFENIANLMLSNNFFVSALAPDIIAEWLEKVVWKVGDESYAKQIVRFIEKNGELSYEYLKLCSLSKWLYQSEYPDLQAQIQSADMFTIFFENFINEPEYTNLIQYLMQNPQKLSNLGWKVVKEIDLNTNSWINFAFRGIIEMVKSRPDLDFPHIKNESEKKLWELQRGKIIKEYENMLRNYISRDFDSERKGKKKPFDKIFYATQYWDNVLDSNPTPKNWVNKFSWSEVSDYSTGWKSADKGPYTLTTPSSKNPVEWTGIEEEYKNLDSNKQILFNVGLQEIEKWWYVYKFEFWNLVRQRISENYLSDNPPQREVFLNNEWKDELKWSKMISDIKKYVKEHPHEKILVCIEHHWGTDWSSGNWWSKEDWIELANISPNIKIRSIRCYFWRAFTNKEIYKQQSPLSWFSNFSPAIKYVSNAVNDGLNKWLWFNELEIYTRLNYQESITPLTEDMEYTNWETWETETWKIWIAQNVKNENNGPDEYYA